VAPAECPCGEGRLQCLVCVHGPEGGVLSAWGSVKAAHLGSGSPDDMEHSLSFSESQRISLDPRGLKGGNLYHRFRDWSWVRTSVGPAVESM
jgi:hypothetical protein